MHVRGDIFVKSDLYSLSEYAEPIISGLNTKKPLESMPETFGSVSLLHPVVAVSFIQEIYNC